MDSARQNPESPMNRVGGFIKKFRVLTWIICGFIGGCMLVSIVGNTSPVPGGVYAVFAIMVALFFFWTGRRTAKDHTAQSVAVAVARAEAAADARALAMAQVVVNNGMTGSQRVIETTDTDSQYDEALAIDAEYERALAPFASDRYLDTVLPAKSKARNRK